MRKTPMRSALPEVLRCGDGKRTGLPGAADEAGAVLFKRLFVGYTLTRVSRERGWTVGMDSWSE